jgi:hypothetical protein
MKPLLFFLLLGPVACAGRVESPAIGYARGSDGTILRVAGVSGAFVTTATIQTGAVSAAFSAQLGVLKLASSVRVLDGGGNLIVETDAPPGPALFGFDGTGATAVAWYPSTGALMLYRAGAWSTVPYDTGGVPVLGVAFDEQGRALVVLARYRLTLARIRVSDGATEDETIVGPGSGPVWVSSRGALLFVRDGMVLYRAAERGEQTLDVPADVVEWVPMGGAWVEARTASGRKLALRLAPAVRVWDLPEVSQ